VIKPWLNPVTASKVSFIQPTELLKHVDRSEISDDLLQNYASHFSQQKSEDRQNGPWSFTESAAEAEQCEEGDQLDALFLNAKNLNSDEDLLMSAAKASASANSQVALALSSLDADLVLADGPSEEAATDGGRPFAS
jgi:hypothetical protein